MAKHGKRYEGARSAIDREHAYSPVEAVRMLKELPAVKFDETIEVHFRLGLNVRLAIGKRSFGERQLVENYAAVIDEIVRAKPAASKGRYIRQITLATTMSPGIHVDPSRVRGIVDELESQEAATVGA